MTDQPLSFVVSVVPPPAGQVDHEAGVVFGDVVEVVRNGAPHVFGRVVLEHFEKLEDRSGILLE